MNCTIFYENGPEVNVVYCLDLGRVSNKISHYFHSTNDMMISSMHYSRILRKEKLVGTKNFTRSIRNFIWKPSSVDNVVERYQS